MAQVSRGKFEFIDLEMAEILISIWNLPSPTALDVRNSLNALFATIPHLYQELYLKLKLLIPSGKDKNSLSASDQRIEFFNLLDRLFFPTELPNDNWIAPHLRSQVEKVHFSGKCYQYLEKSIRKKFYGNRPLNRDLSSLTIQRKAEVVFNIEISFTPDADQEATFAKVLFALSQLLERNVNFSSLEERMIETNFDTNKVYVANARDANAPYGTVTVIDGATDTVIVTIPLTNSP